jgi:NhaA family Na+:H+ antiporter
MWYFMLHSGVHATITGVLLAFAIPFGNGGEKSPSYILQHFLHKPVAFFILPLFAVANTCIAVGDSWQSSLGQTNSLGIMAGLVIGKPLGIWLFSFIGVGIGLCVLPTDLKWKNIIGAGFLGGIGFTMSIFITILAFENADIVNNSKIAILMASLISGVIGFLWLRFTLSKRVNARR